MYVVNLLQETITASLLEVQLLGFSLNLILLAMLSQKESHSQYMEKPRIVLAINFVS